jgi:hypothetical protein
MESRSAYERGPSLVVRWARRAGTSDFCPTLVGTVQNIFFLTLHYFTSFFPIAQQGRQPCHVAYFFIYVFGLHPPPPLAGTVLGVRFSVCTTK